MSSVTKIYNLTASEAFKKLPIRLQTFFTKYPPKPFKQYSDKPTLTNSEDANPFLRNKHPITGKTHSSIYSLRRQSDLYKLAFKFGVSDLLPNLQNDKKFFQDKYDNKPTLKGVLRPKGHKWERTFDDRKQKLSDALEKVDDILIKHRGTKYKKRLERRETEKKSWF
ncbi:hypothetical protein B5S28_g5232 [[Candida] boidinii]|uniref:Unnamed protein product n=1 Tax=Candida boidinii TaxID=5477 RepID=A0ACB5U0M3_CANBO|nr:hypothetical protein B5S28_g5232 [[Candida] boidinii]OWB62127.1 hypothetical protein B5S29_g3046 [[Candida] boidinii]OWB71971.1 hypothetical protein B5S31_g1672 [[Candida] boidinii]GME98745.1 unnamed protein product [[Candida] boidinii]